MSFLNRNYLTFSFWPQKALLMMKGNVIQKHDIIFNILRDIMENYQDFNYVLKLNYPQIIVDIISILYKGNDTTGERISVRV